MKENKIFGKYVKWKDIFGKRLGTQQTMIKIMYAILKKLKNILQDKK